MQATRKEETQQKGDAYLPVKSQSECQVEWGSLEEASEFYGGVLDFTVHVGCHDY